MKRYILAGVAALLVSSGANAATYLTGVTVNGVTAAGATTGTVWNTTQDSYYAVFVQNNFGTTLNPTDQAINSAVGFGDNAYSLAGQTWALENFYKVTLNFSDGATISQIFDRAGGFDLTGSTTTVGGLRYTMDSFSWNNSLTNTVSAFSSTPDTNGKKADFNGALSFEVSAVPEPTSWAMMIAGFAMMGVALRNRRKVATLAHA